MKKTRGFTLFELLISLLIFSILFIFSLSFGVKIHQKNQAQRLVNEIVTAVQLARNNALLYAKPLILTPMPNSTTWSDGMILFADNKKHQLTSKDKIIQQWEWKFNGLTVYWHGFHSDYYLLLPAELEHAASSGHFIIEEIYGQTTKLVVNRLGRIRMEPSISTS